LPGLAKVQCPVMVMAGELDPVTPLVDAQEIAAAIPAPWGRLVTFANAGHGAWRDEPAAAMATLRAFITE
jgi:pimeloyl-ACP methyl ester carboxylesterase